MQSFDSMISDLEFAEGPLMQSVMEHLLDFTTGDSSSKAPFQFRDLLYLDDSNASDTSLVLSLLTASSDDVAGCALSHLSAGLRSSGMLSGQTKLRLVQSLCDESVLAVLLTKTAFDDATREKTADLLLSLLSLQENHLIDIILHSAPAPLV